MFRDSPRVLYRSIPLLAFEEDDPTPYIGLVGMYRRILDERGNLRPYLLLYVDGAPTTLDATLVRDATLEIVAAAEGG
mgnify:CR=1 FL=1